MLAQQRREVTTPRKPRIERDDVLSDKFNDYFENQWKTDFMYLPNDFIDMFGINRHLSGYYLMKMVREGKLFRIKYCNKTYYRKWDVERYLLYCEFIWFGVEVTKAKNKKLDSDVISS